MACSEIPLAAVSARLRVMSPLVISSRRPVASHLERTEVTSLALTQEHVRQEYVSCFSTSEAMRFDG
jgi:hypothetical protein